MLIPQQQGRQQAPRAGLHAGQSPTPPGTHSARPLGHILLVRRHSQVRPTLKGKGQYKAVTTQSRMVGPPEDPCATKTMRALTATQC